MSVTALGRVDDLLERGVRLSLPVTAAICGEMRRHVERATSLDAAVRGHLQIERHALAFGTLFASKGLHLELCWSLEADHLDGQEALQSAALEFSKISVDAAVQWFAKKRLLSQERLGWLKAAFRRKGQVIGKDLQRYVETRMDESLKQAIHLGQTKRAWLGEANAVFDAVGLTRRAPHHLETIYETVGQSAYAHGRWEQMRQPHVMEARPWWKYSTAGDSHVRPSHAAMEGFVARADDEIWNAWYPPNGFRCRCTVVSLSEGEASPAVPDGLLPDEGFRTSPADFLR